jgi:uncharacterized protein YwgA
MDDMSIFERIEKLSALLSAASPEGKIESKKKLHKLVYLLQQAGEDFDENFIFYYFGVFSPTLANDLEFAKKAGVITIEEPKGDAWAYTVKLINKELKQEHGCLSNNSINLINKLVNREPQLLETLSTIVYLNRNYYRGSDLKQKLRELKPDLSEHYTEAFKLSRELFQIEIEP